MVGQVLVIDGVEQRLLVDIDEVRHLKREHAVRCQQCAHAFHHAREVIDMCEHIVGGHDCSRTSLRPNSSRQCWGKECRQSLDPRVRGGPRNLPSRIHAEHPVAVAFEAPQQRAVIGADVQDQSALVRVELRYDVLGIAVEVLYEYPRGAGHVHVMFEQYARVHDVEQLNVLTVVAEEHIQGELLLFSLYRVRGHERVGGRGRLHLDYQREVLPAAQPTLGATSAALAQRPASSELIGSIRSMSAS